LFRECTWWVNGFLGKEKKGRIDKIVTNDKKINVVYNLLESVNGNMKIKQVESDGQ
jgi:hypothetical protein